MSKKRIIQITIGMIVLVVVGGICFVKWDKKLEVKEPTNISEKENTKVGTDMDIVLSLEDKITENSSWCGTFNLIWNDLKNDLVKQDIEFTPQLEIVKNLNKGTFTASYLSEESYYKTYGVPTLELKEEIEKAIQEKFEETSDILDNFNWENHGPEDYFLYAMLKKQFEFPKMFSELEKGNFRNASNVEYFGIDKDTQKEVRQQVKVLYYNALDDFAIQLNTKQNDEVIITRGNQKDTFGSAYEEIKKKSETYEGNRNFGERDTLKIPNIDFDLKKEIQELENKYFKFANGNVYRIDKALQTIQFQLDQKGGKIKSEAGIMLDNAAIIKPEETREFSVDDTFMLFLREEEKDLPYFATKISDIN